MKTAFLVNSVSTEQINYFVESSKSMDIRVPTNSFYSSFEDNANNDENVVFVGAFVKVTEKDASLPNLLLEKCQEQRIPLFVFSKNELPNKSNFATYITVSDPEAKNLLAPCLFNLVPKGFKTICLQSSAFIGQSVFPDMDMKFTESENLKTNENLQVICEVADKSFLSSVTIKVSMASFKSRNELYNDIDDDTLVDSLKEYANQMIGIINFNLAKIDGLAPRGSVPMALLNSNGPCKQNHMFYMPSFFASNSTNDIQIKFDFLNLKGINLKELYDSKFEFITPEETAEFF